MIWEIILRSLLHGKSFNLLDPVNREMSYVIWLTGKIELPFVSGKISPSGDASEANQVVNLKQP